MEFLAGAGAGDIEEALAFGSFAFAMNAVEPAEERVNVLALGGDGREHDVCGPVVCMAL